MSTRRNTAGFVHDLTEGALSNVDGDGNHVRVQVLTNVGALNREKQLAVVRQFTDLVASAAGDPSLTARSWVLLTEAIEGGWGQAGHANTNSELVDAARAQIAELQRGKGSGQRNSRGRLSRPVTAHASSVRAHMTTWSLEITDPAHLLAAPAPPRPLEFRRALQPSAELGRFLYTAVGGNWFWTMRLGWTYERWQERLSHPRVETWVLYADGTPAAYFELDGSIEPDVEIAYLGVMPAFIGRRLGAWLLTTAIQRGFAMGAARVWVHTCTLDSPNALANYKARGMRVFKEHDEPIDLPDETPGPWPGAGIHGPHMPSSNVRRWEPEEPG